ncbi:MAG: DUF192 domain-containing protein [Bacteriovoracaceae bacterium]|nr:DUF192 domain-containing protein [Bacteriovoracaceae bacterium]
MSFITQNGAKLIKNILIIGTLLFISCNSGPQHNSSKETRPKDPYSKVRNIKLAFPSGKLIDTKLAITQEEQTIGLSGTKSSDFGASDALLFFYFETDMKGFWMPNTLFDLAIIFLDKDLKIIDWEIAPHHPGMDEPPSIYRTKQYKSRHVLEIRADSPLVKELEKGLKFKLISKISLSEIESSIRLLQ